MAYGMLVVIVRVECYEKRGTVLHAIVWYGTRTKGGQCVHCTLESLQRKCENLEAGAHPVSVFTHCHDHATEILSEIFVNNTCNIMSVIDPLAKNWTFLQNLSTSTLSFLARSNDPLRFRSISDKVSYITRAIGSLQKLIQIYSDHSVLTQIITNWVSWGILDFIIWQSVILKCPIVFAEKMTCWISKDKS